MDTCPASRQPSLSLNCQQDVWLHGSTCVCVVSQMSAPFVLGDFSVSLAHFRALPSQQPKGGWYRSESGLFQGFVFAFASNSFFNYLFLNFSKAKIQLLMLRPVQVFSDSPHICKRVMHYVCVCTCQCKMFYVPNKMIILQLFNSYLCTSEIISFFVSTVYHFTSQCNQYVLHHHCWFLLYDLLQIITEYTVGEIQGKNFEKG